MENFGRKEHYREKIKRKSYYHTCLLSFYFTMALTALQTGCFDQNILGTPKEAAFWPCKGHRIYGATEGRATNSGRIRRQKCAATLNIPSPRQLTPQTGVTPKLLGGNFREQVHGLSVALISILDGVTELSGHGARTSDKPLVCVDHLGAK